MNRKTCKDIAKKVYALDDNSAIKIDGDNIEVISEGEWIVINNDK